MSESKWQIFGDIHSAMVWTVDDDWFENAMAMNVLPIKSIGGDLSKLITAIDNIGSLEPTTKSMLLYLKRLAIGCKERNLSLCVCNFERFETKFAYANRPGNAVLLDVHRSGAETSRFQNCTQTKTENDVYGIHLLADLLSGTPFL